MKTSNKFFVLTLFGIAFGYVEAAVVVYLRELYYPNGFMLQTIVSFPFIKFGTSPELHAIPVKILLTEIGRETATIIMLASIAFLSGKNIREKAAFFMWPFAVWDIFYYVFLKIIIGWPASLKVVDVLFLIPVPWIAPVWLPVIISLGMLAISWILIQKQILKN